MTFEPFPPEDEFDDQDASSIDGDEASQQPPTEVSPNPDVYATKPGNYWDDLPSSRQSSPFEDEFIASARPSRSGDADGEADLQQPMSRARERQLRRKQQPMVQNRSPRPSSQIKPSDRFKMPQIKLPKINGTLIAIIGGIVLIIIVVIALGRLSDNPTRTLPNAIWIGTEWTYEQPDDAAVKELAERLKGHEIGTLYAWVSWLQADNTWRGTTNFENVTNFVAQFRAADPEAELHGWVSLPVEGDGIPYRLDDPTVRQQVVNMSQRAVNEFGFDGVFLNIEPVWNGDENFLALLREVRAALGSEIPISVAIPPDWSPIDADVPVPPLITPGTIWDHDYKQSVALLVDQMVVMAYNSGLGAPSDYEAWVAYQVEAYADAVSELGEGTAVVIGIPTYDSAPPGHDPYVENVISAVAGIRRGLASAGNAANWVRGLALYGEWTTSDDEWQAFQDSWVNTP
ncbi:MAG: Glycosyl hydrolase family 18 [Chloroflexi bacterium OLB15]|nr:MAG: Glycosyl hydrolase family 18 [Chloroflexi bacterium OLB15]